MTRISFGSDVRTQHACIRNLEVIGEAVKHIPDEVRSVVPEIEWKKIAGLRDITFNSGLNEQEPPKQ